MEFMIALGFRNAVHGSNLNDLSLISYMSCCNKLKGFTIVLLYIIGLNCG